LRKAPSERHLLKIIPPEYAAPVRLRLRLRRDQDGAENILIFVSTNMPRPRRWTKSSFAALTPNRIALNFPA
jgi:hypothetical protein